MTLRNITNDLDVLMCSIGYNQYGGYCVPLSSNHRPAAQRILNGDVYEPQTIKFMINNCGNGDIVHAGAYFGDFLPALSKACSPESKVWAFEPNPENYRCAKITTYLNNLNNIVLANAGVGEKSAKLSMVTTDKSGRGLGGVSKIIGDNYDANSQNVESVQIVSVDEIVPTDRKVSIIQYDVEGHEKHALTGSINTIKRCLPIIILEDWAESDLIDGTWFTENIRNLGYKDSGSLHGNKVFTYKPTV